MFPTEVQFIPIDGGVWAIARVQMGRRKQKLAVKTFDTTDAGVIDAEKLEGWLFDIGLDPAKRRAHSLVRSKATLGGAT